MMQKMGHLLNYGSAVHCVGVMCRRVVPSQAQSAYAGLAHLSCLQRPLSIEHGRQHLSGEGSHSKQPSLYPASTAAAAAAAAAGLVKVPTGRNLPLFSASTAAPAAAAAAAAGQMQDLLCGMAKALMTHLAGQQGLLHQAVASQQHQISYSFPRHHHHHISRNQPVRGQSSACSNTLSSSLCHRHRHRYSQTDGEQTDRQTGRGAGKQMDR